MFSIIVCPQPILVSVINLVHHHTDKTLADPEIGQGWEVEEREISLSWLITARKRSLGQGNIFTSVCHSFCSQGGYAWHACPLPQACTPPGHTCPPGMHAPPQAHTAPRMDPTRCGQ